MGRVTPPDPALLELAAAYRVATEYWDWRNQHVRVAPETLVAVLAALGVDAGTPDACRAALADHALTPWRRVLPGYVVVRESQTARVDVHVPDGASVDVWVTREDGSYHGVLR